MNIALPLFALILLHGCAIAGAPPAGSTLGASGDGDSHCGRLLWPGEQAALLPLAEGLEVSSSTSAALQSVLAKRGSWTLRFAYEDGSVGPQLLREAVDHIIRSGHNQVCVFASPVTDSADGLPFEVSPMRSPAHGRFLDDASEVGASAR